MRVDRQVCQSRAEHIYYEAWSDLAISEVRRTVVNNNLD